MRYLELSKSGKVRTFKGDFKLELRERRETRVSRIVPKSLFLRALFLLLRKLFGDDTLVAQWTRRWKCVWLVVIDGEVVGEFEDRKKAIELEKEYLRRAWS